MKIGKFYIHRASSIKKVLEENYEKRKEKPAYYYMSCGVYLSRIAGLCIYRDTNSHEKLMKEFKEKNK